MERQRSGRRNGSEKKRNVKDKSMEKHLEMSQEANPAYSS